MIVCAKEYENVLTHSTATRTAPGPPRVATIDAWFQIVAGFLLDNDDLLVLLRAVATQIASSRKW